MTYNPQFDQIGQAFVLHYYSKFDVSDTTVRVQGLNDLYDVENSFMTFEGQQVKGRQAILEKFSVTKFSPFAIFITNL
jgi:hypothetical protein